MKRSANPATCFYCGMEVKKTSASIEKHLTKQCTALVGSEKSSELAVILIIEATYKSDYWLIIRAKPTAKMKDLDKFIRDVWVECCGHCSAFSYNRQDIPMSYKIGEVFRCPTTIDYEYDFGSTTYLKVSSLFISDDFDKRKISLIMQNKQPQEKCSKCNKKEAELICLSCYEHGNDAVFCSTCAKKHECTDDYDEDILMPIVNSPRCGVCGYEGPEANRLKLYLPKKEKK